MKIFILVFLFLLLSKTAAEVEQGEEFLGFAPPAPIVVDVSNVDKGKLVFSFMTKNFVDDEKFFVEVSTDEGVTWSIIKRYTMGVTKTASTGRPVFDSNDLWYKGVANYVKQSNNGGEDDVKHNIMLRFSGKDGTAGTISEKVYINNLRFKKVQDPATSSEPTQQQKVCSHIGSGACVDSNGKIEDMCGLYHYHACVDSDALEETKTSYFTYCEQLCMDVPECSGYYTWEGTCMDKYSVECVLYVNSEGWSDGTKASYTMDWCIENNNAKTNFKSTTSYCYDVTDCEGEVYWEGGLSGAITGSDGSHSYQQCYACV